MGMEIIKKIRRKNIEYLFRKFKADKNTVRKTLKAFGEHYGLGEAHVSQLINGFRGCGPNIARQIERKHRPALEAGWLDKEHRDTDPADEVERELSQMILMFYRQDPKRTKAALDKLQREADRKAQ